MSIAFKSIYTKAVSLFDDPAITKSYDVNRILFEKKMYTYLQNAIAMFNNPLSVSIALASYEEPAGVMETFEADGTTKVFEISFTIDEAKFNAGKYEYSYIEDDSYVTSGASVSKSGNKWYVTFPHALQAGKQYAVEQYFPGEFTGDFDSFTKEGTGANAVVGYIKDILSRQLVKSWAEGERNLLLDIRGIMQDSDFKMIGSDRILRSKNEWVDQLDSEISNYQNRLAWQIRFMNGSSKIGRG